MQDLLGGQVPAMMAGFTEAFPYVKAGKLRALRHDCPPDNPSARCPNADGVRIRGLWHWRLERYSRTCRNTGANRDSPEQGNQRGPKYA